MYNKKKISIIQYRNGIYQGQSEPEKPNLRNGMGILITDKGQILIGQWKNDKLKGNALIWLNHNQYVMGEFDRGQFQGYSIFRNRGKVLFAQFNSSKPINKLLMINHHSSEVIKIIRSGPIYKQEEKFTVQNIKQNQVIQQYLNINFNCLSLTDYIKRQFCEKKVFKLQILSNENTIVKFDDQTNQKSLGFVFGAQQTIVSYGVYIGEKLNGMGTKYENSIKYQGQFFDGVLNGLGLKETSNRKCNFYKFQNGKIIDNISLEEGSDDGEMLKKLKKQQHIKSTNFYNGFIVPRIIAFQGTKQITFETNLQEQYLLTKSKINRESKNKNNQSIFLKSINFGAKSQQSFHGSQII